MDGDFQERIYAANVAVHRYEAQNYQLLHPEVYGREEQERTNSVLKKIDQLITGNKREALDFGAGVGNLTGKLLRMGYTVTAVDISPEMCAALAGKHQDYVKAKKLAVINSSIEKVNFAREFDLIACYSVLHHLPDYESAVRRLLVFLRKGGVVYFDHEASPSYWLQESNSVANLAKSLYFHSNPILNSLYFSMTGAKVSKLDYSLSDYWHKKDHHLDHDVIKRVFEEADFEILERTDYHLKGTWIPNPIFYAYRHFCKPEMSCWIAKRRR